MHRRSLLRHSALAGLTLSLGLRAGRARADDLVWLSTQLRPIEEASKVRDVILKGSPVKPAYVVDEPAPFTVRLQAEQQTGHHTTSLIGALHGELQPFAPTGGLMPLDDLAKSLADRGIPDKLMALGRFGTPHQLYIPWMQATYFMAANKKALPYLPKGADLNALTYDQLAAWAEAIHAKTGQRRLGFPAGPKGLMHRFFEGFLYPSYTGGVVTPFRSAAAEDMWGRFASLWKSVNPNSTNYNFMQEPLLSEDVWIGFDHVARLLDALTQKPNDFVTFPAPSGPKGRAYMPVIAGLAIPKGAPDVKGAEDLIRFLTLPATQITTAQQVGFFPVVNAKLPSDLSPGLKLAVGAINATQQAKDALPALLPLGLGAKGGEFDKVFLDAFQLIVLRGQPVKAVLDRQAATLRKIMTETAAPCWSPDAPSTGACPVT
jgi:multiple sugar transport system substrate-binding protein